MTWPGCIIYASRVAITLSRLPKPAPRSWSSNSRGLLRAASPGQLVGPVDQTLSFGDFRLDITRRSLIKGNEITPLPERLFGVLSLLIQANGRVVEKETFATIVWPDVIMTDSNLAQHIYQLRQLLGETARSRSYIASASGRGYRFTAPVLVARRAPESFYDRREARPNPLCSDFEPSLYCCLANYRLESGSLRAIEQAIELFEASLELNTTHAPALVGLGRAYALLTEYGAVSRSPALKDAKAAAALALELSPGSAIAHAVQSNLLVFDDWDWAGASCEIEIALRLDPESPVVRSSAASFNLCAGRHERAMIDVQIALSAAPPSVTLLLQLANILIHSGRYRDAITTLSNLLKSDSTRNVARRYRALACLLDGRTADAIVDLNLLAPEQSEDSSLRLSFLARAYADSGEQSRAAGIYSTLLNARWNGCSTFWSLALIATGLGKFEEAVCHLEEALQVREPALLFLKGLPFFEPISQFERFKTVARAAAVDRRF